MSLAKAFSRAAGALPTLTLMLAGGPAVAETRGYVVSMIHTATYGDQDTCPKGGNGGPTDIKVRRLMEQGYTKDQATKIIGNMGVDENGKKVEITKKGRINGREVDPGDFPTSVPDPKIEIAQGRYAYGFDLDGKAGPGSFEDPDTHTKGVDNALWKSLGCFTGYNIRRPVRPYSEDIAWDTAMDSMPGWLISVTGADLSKDGEVTVTFDRALDVTLRDGHGGVLSGATYTVDADPRSHSVLKGRIKDQVLTVDDGQMAIQGESQFYAWLRFVKTHVRFKMLKDGSLTGIVGGYQPWRDYYYFLAIRGEDTGQVDLPGVYYAMKRLADGIPDPTTGENTAISAAYYMEAVPAFHTTQDGKVMAKAFGPGPLVSGPAVLERADK
ncbi:MAG: hypothetical protein K1X51_17625 [Rhodospirillaceae bacterium]|nr:hypothetical protein [Rhodospirillaceae bacterium]